VALADAMPILLLVLVALTIVGVMVARIRAKRGQGQRLGPVAVPPEEAELSEGAVFACMACGSPHVRQARAVEGIVPGGGANLTWICARCGRRGPPLEFDSPTAFREFVKALNEDERNRPPPGAG
jgi:hypothetical protein